MPHLRVAQPGPRNLEFTPRVGSSPPAFASRPAQSTVPAPAPAPRLLRNCEAPCRRAPPRPAAPPMAYRGGAGRGRSWCGRTLAGRRPPAGPAWSAPAPAGCHSQSIEGPTPPTFPLEAGEEQEGGRRPGQLHRRLAHLAGPYRVDPDGGVVEEERRRIVEQSPGQVGPLPHPPRETLHPLFAPALKPHQLQHLVDPPGLPARFQRVEVSEVAQVVEGAEPIVEPPVAPGDG